MLQATGLLVYHGKTPSSDPPEVGREDCVAGGEGGRGAVEETGDGLDEEVEEESELFLCLRRRLFLAASCCSAETVDCTEEETGLDDRGGFGEENGTTGGVVVDDGREIETEEFGGETGVETEGELDGELIGEGASKEGRDGVNEAGFTVPLRSIKD